MTPEQTLEWLAQQHFDQCCEERPIQDWIRKMKSQLPEQLALSETHKRQCNVKPWVSLTDEEIIIMSRYDLEYAALIGEVQRKLKEKNA